MFGYSLDVFHVLLRGGQFRRIPKGRFQRNRPSSKWENPIDEDMRAIARIGMVSAVLLKTGRKDDLLESFDPQEAKRSRKYAMQMLMK